MQRVIAPVILIGCIVGAAILSTCDAMAAARLPVLPEWIIDGDFSIGSGESAGERFLELADRPTAMFSANDEMAIGFLAVLRAVAAYGMPEFLRLTVGPREANERVAAALAEFVGRG